MREWDGAIRGRLAGAGLDGAAEAEVVEELAQHLEDRYQELRAAGHADAAARELALAELAEGQQLAARLRRARRAPASEPVPVGASGGEGWWARTLADVRYATRLLRRSPAFAAVAVLLIALGIGANTVVYSVIRAVVLRPTPGVASPGELVVIHTSDYSGPRYSGSSYPDYESMQGATDAFSGAAAYTTRPFSVGTGERAERVLGELVSGNYFRVLGVRPALGRGFLPEEEGASGQHPVAVISHGLWQRTYGGAADVIGRTLRVNGHELTVVGVAPEAFRGSLSGLAMDVWVPMSAPRPVLGFDVDRRSSRGLFVVARLNPGVTLSAAQARMNVLARQLYAAYPREWSDLQQQSRVLTVVPQAEARLPRMLRGAVLGFFALLAGIVGIVLLVTCANVANLMLARASARQSELGVRLALGATRARVASQLLMESLLLAALGGALGVLLALWLTRLLNTVRLPLPMAVTLDVSLDATVLAFAVLVTVGTGVLFGLAPALQASRAPAPMLRAAGSGSGRGRIRLRNALVVLQVAASLVLLVGGGLFLRSLLAAQAIDPGFDSENVVLVPFELRSEGYTPEAAAQFYAEVVPRVAALPGVRAATLAESVPLGLGWSRRSIDAEGYSPAEGEDMEIGYNGVGAGYFSLMGIPLQRGREFTAADRAGAPPVVMVNEAFARRYWPGLDPLGRRVSLQGDEGPWAEVIGIVPDGKYRSLTEEPTPFIYYPHLQLPASAMTLHLRTDGDPTLTVPLLRRTLRTLAPRLPVPEITTLEQHVGLATLPQRIAATMLGAFGVLALAIAAIGLYGVVAYTVVQRTREFGIRMALGARAADVRRMVVRQGLRLGAAGLAIGLALAFLLARLVQGLLVVSPGDPVAFLGVPLLLLAAAAIASYIPARRATRADPVAALRSD